MRVLIVDDEVGIRSVLREYFEIAEFEVDEAENGGIAIEMVNKKGYDIIIMDIMMPVLDGYSAVKEIKKDHDTPILMLSARTEESDRIFGFEIGVEDYVTKPFSPREVVMRVQNILKRGKRTIKRRVFRGLAINMTARTVSVDGEIAMLTPKEYDLLFYLIDNEDVAISREDLLRDVWGREASGEDRTVDTHIKMLRSNLGEYRDVVHTVRGIGYKLKFV